MASVTRRRWRWLIVGVAVLVVIGGWLATRGVRPPSPNPPGTFSFALLGDAPYYVWEDLQYRLVLQDLNAHDLSAIIHVGDIFWRPCSDARYERTLTSFEALRHPVIYTPGDNEWTDCWERGSGGFAPLERLQRLRQIFFPNPATSLGRRRLPLSSQANDSEFAEFVENVRWVERGLVFATVHLVGTLNGLVPFEGRTSANDLEARRRTAAATAWARAAFAEARTIGARGVVLLFHANLGLESPRGSRWRQPYEPFVSTLEEELARVSLPVLIVHGDFHEYLVDHPITRPGTGERLQHVTRLQVPGSPDVGWVRVIVSPETTHPFTFEPHIVPRWKFW